ITRLNRCRAIFVFDYDSFAANIGKNNIVNDKMRYLADMKISPDIIPHLCEEYMRYIRALAGLMRKCVVLDLDNTLWGGIVGEDGFHGIKLGPTAPGNAYVEFQKHILALFRRGIILAINSSNNEADAMKVLREHPHMILREHHFASLKINWENKAKNIVDIAKDINIGLDSMVFIDDDKRNREIVKAMLPQVLCPELPEGASGHARMLREIKELDSLQITREDKKRGRLYATERKRKKSKDTFRNLSEYLKALDITVEIGRAGRFSIPRISQLTMRTNQFNFSAKRYDEKEIERITRDTRYSIYHIKVKDKYGDYGIVGALFVKKSHEEWLVDTFLLSCRVLGRNIEDAVISALIREAARKNIERLTIFYKKTEKNEPAFRFLKRYGDHSGRGPAKSGKFTLYKKGGKIKSGSKLSHVRTILK
ncbi:MAG: HAD-IIIC family phosphatase, partial [Omnitrophica bacterium]|nr:HAD-IIIC family phosphatase [Candidatus Omnitrophota bacterium]